MKVILTGPESTGKTTLALQLCTFFNLEYIPEIGRIYLTENGLDYTLQDLESIIERQWESEELRRADAFQILDTSFLVLKIWLQEKFEKQNAIAEKGLLHNEKALYLLCSGDIPWDPDPMRENPSDRERLFEKYFDTLKALDARFTVLQGSQSKRFQNAITFIKENMEN